MVKIQFVLRKLLYLIGAVTMVAVGLPAQAQVRLGIKGGLSTSDLPASSLIIKDQSDIDWLQIRVEDAKYGIHLGMFIQVKIGLFFIQPEILFNTVTVDYSVEDLRGPGITQVKDELYRNLDVPLILGLKFGPVRIGGGPVAHLFLDNTSDLLDITSGYQPDFEPLSYGWQAGIGLDVWKLHLDARYEGNFNNYGDHFVFFDRQYQFNKSPSRILVSAGISF